MKARGRTVKVRMTDEELAAAERNAAAEGVPLAVFLRRLAVSGDRMADSQARVRRALELLGSLSAEEAGALRANVREVREAWRRGRR